MNDSTGEELDSRRFRDLMGAFPTGVTVVTALREDGSPAGLTANSFTSVSLAPPLVLVCVGHGSSSHDAIVGSGAFAVNLLSAESEGTSNLFASSKQADRFADLAWEAKVTGSPVLASALGWLDCRVHQTHVAGDHTIVVGEVQALELRDGAPLVYHRGKYARLAD